MVIFSGEVGGSAWLARGGDNCVGGDNLLCVF